MKIPCTWGDRQLLTTKWWWKGVNMFVNKIIWGSPILYLLKLKINPCTHHQVESYGQSLTLTILKYSQWLHIFFFLFLPPPAKGGRGATYIVSSPPIISQNGIHKPERVSTNIQHVETNSMRPLFTNKQNMQELTSPNFTDIILP